MHSEADISDKTPREILSRFYAENNLPPDGGQSEPTVKIVIAPGFHFYIPNPDSRKKAVIKHDMHHLATGYRTNIAGESEISAWEVASGCKSWLLFFIDTSGVMLGYLIYFPRVLRAFARGRRTKNLYHDIIADEVALDMTVAELQKALLLDKNPIHTNVTFGDVILYLFFGLFGAIFSLLTMVLLPFVVIYSVYAELKVKKQPVNH